MKVAQKQANSALNRSATEATQSSWQNQLAQVADNSKEAVAQRAFIAGINGSPRMVAQRRQIEGYLGTDQPQTAAPLHPTSQINQQQPIQRLEKLNDEEKEPLQRKFTSESPAQLKESVPKTNNTGLPDNLKSGIESLSGLSMDNVKVHYNSSQPAQLNALAYAQGTDIHVAPGQEQHLPHEAWHVVQQAQGRVQPTMQMKDGIQVNDDKRLEHEADMMGDRALRTGSIATPSHISQDRTGLFKTQPRREEPIRGSGEKGPLNLLASKFAAPVIRFSHSSETAQLVTVRNRTNKWSSNDKYVTSTANTHQNHLGVENGNHLPDLTGAVWNKGAEVSYGPQDNRVVRYWYTPKWEENDEDNVEVPQDCITTAELVSAWYNKQDADQLGLMLVPPRVEQANQHTSTNPGDIMFHVHSKTSGDFHAAGVVASDDPDVITMEADASQDEIDGGLPLFDMYAGHTGFRASQHLGRHNERTYVIKLTDGNSGRSNNEQLWNSIQQEINAGNYTEAGEAAAKRIRVAIQTILAQPGDRRNEG